MGEDAVRLLSEIPADGEKVTNEAVRNALGWEKEVYFKVRDELLDQGLVDTHRGRGGLVARVVSRSEAQAEAAAEMQAEAEEAEAQAGVFACESDLYGPIAKVLREDWAADLGRTERFVVEVIAHQGSAKTGGRWSRPDIAAVSLQIFPLTGAKVFDVFTFEVKFAGAWDVTAIYEAAAHGRRATFPYAFLHHDADLKDDDPALGACVKEAKRLGVGVITSPDPADYESWSLRVDAERHTPDPQLLEEFVAQQFPHETVKQIRGWW